MSLQMTLPSSGLLVGPCSNTGLPDLEWLERQLQDTEQQIRMVTLVNPGNPTGTLLDRSFVQKAVDLCRQYQTWLILDCTYEYFVPNADFDGCFHDDAAHVIHIFSFSKAYALAGYRVGYMTISKQAGDLYDQVMKVQDTIPICPSRISQIAALGSMSAGKDWVRHKIASLDEGRTAILDALSSLEMVMGGSGAMYVMGKLRDGTDDKELTRRLVQEFGVACIPGSFCGFPGWIRVCYSNLEPEKCKEAAARLKLGLESLQG
jgi:aspartate/methionine/tyrosine aminotransferase